MLSPVAQARPSVTIVMAAFVDQPLFSMQANSFIREPIRRRARAVRLALLRQTRCPCAATTPVCTIRPAQRAPDAASPLQPSYTPSHKPSGASPANKSETSPAVFSKSISAGIGVSAQQNRSTCGDAWGADTEIDTQADTET